MPDVFVYLWTVACFHVSLLFQISEEEYHKEQLRIYQLNRLKYYYGVIECDSKETANHIYEECDGIEYEGSSNRIDLRFADVITRTNRYNLVKLVYYGK